MTFGGELAGLGAAFCWAVAAALFRRCGETIPPFTLNLLKGVIAVAIALATLGVTRASWTNLEVQALGLLLLSGVIGIGIGDSAFFASLNRLGDRRTLLISETLPPPITALIAFATLGQRLSLVNITGIGITMMGVWWVLAEKRSKDEVVSPHEVVRGIAFGVLSALCQSVGLVLSAAALTRTETGPLWATLMRLLGGTVCLCFVIPVFRQPFFPDIKWTKKTVFAIATGTVVGTL